MDLPLAPVERLLKRTKMRVSKDAVSEFAMFLEEIICDVSSEAARIAKARRKRTISVKDIKIAEKNFRS